MLRFSLELLVDLDLCIWIYTVEVTNTILQLEYKPILQGYVDPIHRWCQWQDSLQSCVDNYLDSQNMQRTAILPCRRAVIAFGQVYTLHSLSPLSSRQRTCRLFPPIMAHRNPDIWLWAGLGWSKRSS